jgi:hypothetical protein
MQWPFTLTMYQLLASLDSLLALNLCQSTKADLSTGLASLPFPAKPVAPLKLKLWLLNLIGTHRACQGLVR